eukprot:60258-Alexandrium_andersonii.AAC.1
MLRVCKCKCGHKRVNVESYLFAWASVHLEVPPNKHYDRQLGARACMSTCEIAKALRLHAREHADAYACACGA